MHLKFVCDQEKSVEDPEGHDTAILMKRCVHCGGYAVAGYRCTCGYEDVDAETAIVGHGEGKCT
jgi:hypothetical protein